MKVFATSIEDYLATSGDNEADLRAVDQLIRTHAPHLKPVLYKDMSGGVGLGYGLVPYQTKSMKTPSQCPLLALARQKHYMALYACAVIDGKYIGEQYADTLGNVSVGKSCIRFKRLSHIDLANLTVMIKDIDTRHANGEVLFG